MCVCVCILLCCVSCSSLLLSLLLRFSCCVAAWPVVCFSVFDCLLTFVKDFVSPRYYKQKNLDKAIMGEYRKLVGMTEVRVFVSVSLSAFVCVRAGLCSFCMLKCVCLCFVAIGVCDVVVACVLVRVYTLRVVCVSTLHKHKHTQTHTHTSTHTYRTDERQVSLHSTVAFIENIWYHIL